MVLVKVIASHLKTSQICLDTICNMKEKILFRYIKNTYSIRRGKTRKNEKRKMIKQYEYPAKRKVGWLINT